MIRGRELDDEVMILYKLKIIEIQNSVHNLLNMQLIAVNISTEDVVT